MEARQDGTITVSISPKLLEDLGKVKKNRKLSAGSSGISKQRKLQLAEVVYTILIQQYSKHYSVYHTDPIVQYTLYCVFKAFGEVEMW